MTEEQRRDVEKVAYFIWDRDGQPANHALDHWLEAETIVLTNALTLDIELPSVLPVGIY